MLRLSLSLHHACCLPPLHFSQQRRDDSAAVTSVKRAHRRASGRWSDPLIPRRAHMHQGSSNGSRWARNGKVLMDCPPAAQQCIAASMDRGGQMNFRPLPFLAVPHTLERAQRNLPGSETSWCHSLSEQQSWSGWEARRCGNQ